MDVFGDLNIPILFPIHPRTRKNLENFGIDSKISSNIRIVEPLGYFETLSAIKDAIFVATDSGGIQQEAFVLKTPCVTIRRSYEWRETFDAGVNFLANPETPDFKVNVDTVRRSAEAIRLRFSESEPVFGDGHASERIANLLKRYA